MSTYELVTRAEWNARPPLSVTSLNWSKVDKFIVHYSGAVRTQTVRSIQNFCMDNKGHSDIDYNRLVRGKLCYVGRENNVGSHTLGLNSTSYGVCVIGMDGDATDDDFRTVREIYDELTVKLGRQLRQLGHRTAMPPGYTTCPGNEIQRWIDAGMPYPSEDAMALTPLQDAQNSNSEHYLQSIVGMTLEAENISNTVQHDLKVPNKLTPVLLDIQAKLGGVSGVGISEDRLRQIIREEIAKTRLT